MSTNTTQSKNNYIGRATIIIAVFSVLAKIVGLARDAVFSNRFGTSEVMDAYFAAFRIPDFIFNLLILGTFSVAFIPIFSEYLAKNKESAMRLASSILNFTLILITGLCVFALIFIEPLLNIITPGFSEAQRELTKLFTQIFLLSPIFLTLSSIVSSILNSYKRFTLVAAAPVIYNLSIIFGALVLYPRMGNSGLALGVVIGAILHFGVQLPQLFRIGFKYQPVLEVKNEGFRKFALLYLPRVFSMGSGQVTLLIATIFGSYLSAGSLASFYYANNLQAVFLSVFAISSSIVIFPLLSDLFNEKDETGFKDVIAKTSVQILYFMIPISVLMLIMRAQLVRLILGFGQNTNFTFDDTRLVSLTLGLFVVSLFAQGLIPLFTRAFYARQNTMTPVITSAISVVVNVGLTYFLVGAFGIPGMALAFSLTSVIHLILLLAELHHRIGNLHDDYLIISSLKILISSAIAGTATYLSLYVIAPAVNMTSYLGIFIQASGAGLVGISVFLSASWLLGIDETHNLLKVLRNMLHKSVKAFTVIADYLSN